MADLIVNERETPEGLLVALCDAEALGETYENGEVTLSVTESFYGGEEVDASGATAALHRAVVANIVGVQAVEVAIEAGVIDEDSVLEVGETRHAQYLKLG